MSSSRRNALTNLIAEQLAVTNADRVDEKATDVARIHAGPVRAMSLTLDKMEAETQALQDALASGEKVVELDPGAIVSSFASDRFDAEADEAFETLRASIEAKGQEVPILVRPSLETSGRFQVAYGHRRLRVARILGLKVKAIVRRMTDEELVIAQGLENSARSDLSFIEKVSFAKSLEEKSFSRTTIMRALAIDKTELSRMLSLAHSLPEEIVRQIGSAPKTGRRRWQQLADLIGDAAILDKIRSVIRERNFAASNSDIRFNRALATALRSDIDLPLPDARQWQTPDGKPFARFSRKGAQTSIQIDDKIEPNFGAFLAAQIDEIYRKFRSL